MPYQGHGQAPFPDHRRVHRADDPKLRGPIPALFEPVENGNQVVNAESVTLNRAGSHRRNPVMAGLGFALTMPLGTGDDLKGLFLYQRHSSIGGNLRAQATLAAPGVWAYEFLVGSGQSVAGTPAVGPKKNYVRVQTARGSYERQFWAQSYEHDVVVLNGEHALDQVTLQPVEIVAEIVDASRPWLDVQVDFMPGWNDEFLALHRAGQVQAEAGFLKAYGGAAFVSFFDKTPGTEGVGVHVNPLNQVPIEARRTIQVQNTAGLKEITCRFRSKQGSPYFVDVPLKLRLVDLTELCNAPATEPCSDVYIKAGAAVPVGYPSVASVPGVQVTAGPAANASQDLLLITTRAAMVGGAPKLRIRRWKYSASIFKLAGAFMVQVGADQDYLPLQQTSSSPIQAPPFQAPKRLTVALSVAQLQADQVAFIEAVAVDGTKPGMSVLIPGPRARDIQFLPIGGAGGGPVCGY
jgi:hypothetical protein